MIPWELLEEAEVPGGAERLRLYRRGQELSIRVGTHELMNSRLFASERALGQMACARLSTKRDVRVLVGGLGIGFTLAAALETLGPHAEVVVAELVPAVVRWHAGPLGEVAGHPLRDPRVRLHEGDVGALLRANRGRHDAIMLDVDNGLDGLTRGQNAGLYGRSGLGAAKRALRPGGVLWLWSASRRPADEALLRRAGFTVREHRVRGAINGKGPIHTLWEAAR